MYKLIFLNFTHPNYNLIKTALKRLLKNIAVFLIFLFLVTTAYYFYPEDSLPENCVINRIVVDKSLRKLYAYQDDVLLKTYKIALGSDPVGHKLKEGDGKTPEGNYVIFDKNPNSICYKNLGISYPNDSDKIVSKKLGVSPGGNIKIHGLLNGKGYWGKFHRWFDWTKGCIGVTNSEMDELYTHTIKGAEIEIKP